MIYIISYALSVFFAYAAKICKSKRAFIFFSIISVTITALLAGLRDISIGVDTKNYYYNPLYWSGAQSSENLIEYLKYYINSTRSLFQEIIYIAFLGAVQKTTNNYQFFLFLEHLLIVGFVYIGAFRMRHHANPVITLLLFYLLYFAQSLNITRQYIVMAILFASLKDIENEKYLKYTLINILCLFIHSSAFFGMIPLVIYRILYPKSYKYQEKTTLFRRVIMCSIIVAGSASMIYVIQYFMQIGLLSKYRFLFDSEYTGILNFFFICFMLVEFFGILLFNKSFKKNNTKSYFFAFCSLAFFALNIVGGFMKYGDRMSEYLSLQNIITIGMISNCQNRKSDRMIVDIITVLTVVIYWIILIPIHNSSYTMPYVFCFN